MAILVIRDNPRRVLRTNYCVNKFRKTGLNQSLKLSLHFASLIFVGIIIWVMANPLPPDLPPGFWDDCRKRIEADIASLRRDLDPLEAGEMHLRSIGTDGVMHDVTESWISHFRRTIKNYYSILDALKTSEPL
jgi:hypothetical protein